MTDRLSFSCFTAHLVRAFARRTLPFVALLLLGAALGCEVGIPGNGDATTELRAVSGFSQVENQSSLDVAATQGDSFSVTVRIDSNLQDDVVTRVSGDTLIIDERHLIGRAVRGPHVVITMPRVLGARVSGSGRMTAGPFVQGDEIALGLDGSGDLAFTGDVPRVVASLDGSGDLRVAGTAGSVDLRLDGSGRLDAKGCAASSANLSLSGSGDLLANASVSARVSLSGSGDVDLYGPAVLEEASISGSGDLHRH